MSLRDHIHSKNTLKVNISEGYYFEISNLNGVEHRWLISKEDVGENFIKATPEKLLELRNNIDEILKKNNSKNK